MKRVTVEFEYDEDANQFESWVRNFNNVTIDTWAPNEGITINDVKVVDNG